MNHEMQEREDLFKFEMKLRETKLKLQAEPQGKQANPIQTAQTPSEEISARTKLPKVEITVTSVELIETGPSFGVNFLRQ